MSPNEQVTTGEVATTNDSIDRNRRDKPTIVAIGGGHGLAVSLRAARRYAGQITAVVSVADDGGSSGRLRAELGVPAPGDVRRCLAALADGNGLAQALEHRFSEGELTGHALGNLLLAGLTDAQGDFVAAIDEVGRLVGASGRVLPAASEPVVLVGRGPHGMVEGQVAIRTATVPVDHISVWPAAPATPPEVAAAILDADQVVIGPGSLYTSVLAASVVPAVREALAATTAQRVYVANLRAEEPEAAGYDGADHLAALHRHGIPVDIVIREPGTLSGAPLPVVVVDRHVARPHGLAHDPDLLADALGAVLASAEAMP